ncbi:MAG TPA: sulfate adenylyltransferase subunit CysN, partial [Sphingomicrobium sp.]|nr:sulfate adenylyltransferase subunit CysN [Sphingomicrobium sp.]
MATLAKTIDAADVAREQLEQWIDATQSLSLLRFITCGSVDDGKSTLIGRLLYDSKLLFEDQLSALASDSRKHGTQDESLDFALLVDGLSAEREQGITIDVAYRFFATDRRKFIVADTPGHEQYTRNMVTGASTADLAVILVDARKGVLSQTRRHSFLVKLLGIRHVVLAINKMDLVGYDQQVFDAIAADYAAFAEHAGIEAFTAIPISGLAGDNITGKSNAMPWYEGPALLEHLEEVPTQKRDATSEPFRMAVQWVSRPDASFRGYAGRIASGYLRVGDPIVVLPAGRRSAVERIVTQGHDLKQAINGQSVTLTLADEIDCSRGDVIVSATAIPETTSRIDATLVWMSEQNLVKHRSYWLKIGTQTSSANVDLVHSVIDIDGLAERAGEPLGLNDIGRVVIDLDRPIPALRYAQNRKLGGFILIDKLTNATVAAGLIEGFPAAPKLSLQERPNSIRWVLGPRRGAW